MGIFKAYLKICYKKMPVILIYVAIFAGFLSMFSQQSLNEPEGGFIRTVFLNEDKGSELSQGLYEHLEKYCEFIEVDEGDIADALFIGEVEYVIEIDKGFEENFQNGEEVLIKRQSKPDSLYTMTLNAAINNYLNNANIFNKYTDINTVTELVDLLEYNMSLEGKITLFNQNSSTNDTSYFEGYFNYLSFIMIACFILIVGSITSIFQKKSIKRRNLVSPITIGTLNATFLLYITYAYSFARRKQEL